MFRNWRFLLLSLILLSPAIAAEGRGADDIVGRYVHWDQGIQLTGPRAKVELKIGGKVHYDLGTIHADDELEAAFPGFDGGHDDFRRLSVSLAGRWQDVLEFKLEIDVANVRDIKDNWLRVLAGPVLPHLTVGHMKEPFSLDMLTSGNATTFLEWSLPTRAFGPFRNMGVMASGAPQAERVTVAGGLFLATGSFARLGEASDRISEADGLNLTGRVTGLPWYEEDGRRLLHLGLSYSHRFRDDAEDDPSARYRTRPESRLTDDRLVDTGLLLDAGQDVVGLEAAWVHGPISLQGEYVHAFVDSREDLDFSGWYVQASWVVTGESRAYRRSAGVFTGVRPARIFDPRAGGWGALELAARYSAVDLNDGHVRGGRERNVSLAVNWYLTRNIRLMVNYIHATVRDRTEPRIDSGRADLVLTRLQVSF